MVLSQYLVVLVSLSPWITLFWIFVWVWGLSFHVALSDVCWLEASVSYHMVLCTCARCLQDVWLRVFRTWGFPDGLEDKASAYNARDPGSIRGLERSPGEGNGNPLRYSCLKNPMYRGAWRAIVHRVAKSQTQLRDWAHTHTHLQH